MIALDAFALISIASYLVLWAVIAVAAPRRDLEGNGRLALGCLLAGTLLAYSAASLPLFLAGWALTVLPYVIDGSGRRGPRMALLAATAALAAGTLAPGPAFAFGALVVAALIRKGIFPFHAWTVSAFETGSLPAASLLLNSHLGAYLLMRFALPRWPGEAAALLPWLSLLALFTSVYMALAGLAERSPRRILGTLCTSQASFLLAGLGNRTEQGITGALLHWWVVGFAISGMTAVYASLEARSSEVRAPKEYLGLGVHAPRLAAFFAVCGFALAGLPGTLGFVAEDLLFHGALSAHSMLGAALPLATALNAISVMRLFATLFLGRRGNRSTPVPDALLRERLALTATVLFLVLGGLAPGVLIGLRTPSAAALSALLTGR